jgi:uncharacterized protein (DUF1778 family)
MARPNTRSSKMSTPITFRGTEEDKQKLISAAKSKGLDMSGFIRQLLIREGVLSPF